MQLEERTTLIEGKEPGKEAKERLTLQVHIDTSERAYLQFVNGEITKQQYMEAVQETRKREEETGSPYLVREVPIDTATPLACTKPDK